IPVKLWIAPPTKMDAQQLTEEGHYGVFGNAGARTEMPGCSLCMGNQAQVREGATVMSTSTRNFPNRLGKNANVYLGSAELAAICFGGFPVTAEAASFMSWTILLSLPSQYSASTMRTASRPRLGSVGPCGNQALDMALKSASFLAWSSTSAACPATET